MVAAGFFGLFRKPHSHTGRTQALTFVPLAMISIRALTVITYVSLVASMVPFVLGLIISDWTMFGVGLVLSILASWIDRWRAARVVQARFGRLIAMWHDDVDAVQAGRPRPDIRLLDVPPDLVDLPKPRGDDSSSVQRQ